MKKIVIMPVLFLCLFVVTNVSMAGAKNFYIKINALYVVESIDEEQTQDKFSEIIEIDFDNSWGFQARGGWIFNKCISAEAMFEFINQFEATGNDGNKDELSVMNFTLNGKFSYPLYKKFIPYAIVGLGAMNVYENIYYNGRASKTSDLGLCARGGLGIDYYINDNLSFGCEGSYVTGFGDVDHIHYFVISAGLAWYFF